MSNNGAMIALMLPPDIAQQLAGVVPDSGISPQDAASMHVTLINLQDADSYDDGEIKDILETLQMFAANEKPITGSINGVGRFFTENGDGRHPVYANFDSPDLPAFRQRLVDAGNANILGGLEGDPDHGFTPHITLGYVPTEADTPDISFDPVSCTMDAITLAWGDKLMKVPLGEAIDDEASKAIMLPISDDGDPFEVDDVVSFDGWDQLGNTTGSSFLGIIRGINGLESTIEYFDPNMQPTGQLCVRPLSGLREYMIAGFGDADDGDTPDASAKAVSADAPNSAFAYVPKGQPPSARKLPLTEDDGTTLSADRIHAAWEAVTVGLEGNKADVPSNAVARIKSRIKAAANKLPDGDEKTMVLDYINGKSDSASKSLSETEVRYAPIEFDGYVDTAVKAIEGGDGWRIGGYLILFGGPQQTDLQGEWFTKSTEVGLDWYNKRPMLYEHSTDPNVGAAVIGIIDTLKADDLGWWVEGQLDKRDKYAAKVKELVAKGALGWSSGSMAHLVKKQRGEIKRWPICEASVTVQPAEPRTLAVGVKSDALTPFVTSKHFNTPERLINAYKNLHIPTDKIEPPAKPKVEARQHSVPGGGVGATAKSVSSTVSTHEDEMNEQDKSDIVAAVLAGMAGKNAQVEAQTDAAIDNVVAATQGQNRVQSRLASDGQVYTHALPQPGSRPAAKYSDVQVLDNLRYAELSSEDLSFLTQVYASVAAASRNKTNHSPFEQAARDFFFRAAGDPNRSLQREISAKAIREHNRNQLPDSTLSFLPYKSLDAVFANDFDDSAIKAAIKANELDNTGQTGFGLEWVPTIWNSNLWRRVRISNPLAANMQMIDMPANPYKLPIESTDPTVYFVGEATDQAQLVLGSGNSMTLSKVASDARTLTAKKLGTRVGFSTELVEDSIIPILPYYRYQAQRVLQNYVDDTIVNGDVQTTANLNVNLMDGTPTAGTSYLAMDGLRKYCLVTNTAQALDNGGGTPTLAQFRALRKTLNKHYAADLPNLVYVISYETYMKMLSMPEFTNWGQLGIPGSNVTGLLPLGSPDTVGDTAKPVGVIDGIPVFVSAQIGLAKNTGYISATPANNTFGTAVLYHRTRWFLGYRRQIDLQVLPTGVFSDTYQLWATVRFALTNFDTQSAATLYDIAV